MRRRVDSHRRSIRILGCNVLIHLEKIPVSLVNGLASETLDGFGEIEIDAAPARTDAARFVAHFLRRPRGDVARSEIAEARILALQVVIALAWRDFLRRPFVALLPGNPDAAVVAQRLRHQG